MLEKTRKEIARDKITSIRSRRIESAIYRLLLVFLVGGVVGILPSPTDALGQHRMSERQCLKELEVFIRRTGTTPNRADYARAQRRCAAGDIKGAIALVRGRGGSEEPRRMSQEQCLRRLEVFIRRSGIRPNRGAYARAERRCATGDINGAIAIVRGRGGAEARGRMTQKVCLEELGEFIKRNGDRPNRATYARAQRRCASGDLRGAIAVVRGQGGSQEPQRMSRARCLRELEMFIKRSGVRPNRRTYAQAERRCGVGDINGAIAVVGGRRRPM